MAFSFKCADAGGSCPGAFQTESREEVLQHIQMHAQAAHPEMKAGPQELQQLAQMVKQV